MKNRILFIILVVYSSILFSQEKNFYDVMGYPKVTLNKNIRAYNVSFKEIKNGTEMEEKTFPLDVNNPHYISIKSSKNSGRVTIKNKGYKKDIIIDFKTIYQGQYENGQTPYYFITEDENYDVGYIEVNGSNDFLFIKIKQGSNNELSIDYTISEL